PGSNRSCWIGFFNKLLERDKPAPGRRVHVTEITSLFVDHEVSPQRLIANQKTPRRVGGLYTPPKIGALEGQTYLSRNTLDFTFNSG
ncbi:MAG TPA: hypothetical protein PLP04_10735, partial [Bryobacteraceae bacterium]|nr:hypothetical protein [Bryobacteraceae bacterium]